MASSYDIEVFSHNSIYNNYINNSCYNRKLKVYFSIPEKGVNENTGILLFIAGFGGQATSNVYKKMRDKFSDEYNLVTIQCDYFGYEFMQSEENIVLPNIDDVQLNKIFSPEEVKQVFENGKLDFNIFLAIGRRYNMNLEVKADLSKENLNNFNDMGFCQGIDNIIAVLNVMNILYDNNLKFNSKKAIIYGHSHGAYLAYLCNAFAPKLFSLIIDNSSWLYPAYLKSNRFLYNKFDKLTIVTIFDYLAKRVLNDTKILDLSFLYTQFKNNCNIVSYHGTTDNLISHGDKSLFCNAVDKCIYNEISQNEVDNDIFKSTNHGLDADFIKLFNYTMDHFDITFDKDTCFDLQNEVVIQTNKHKYIIDYQNVMPRITIL